MIGRLSRLLEKALTTTSEEGPSPRHHALQLATAALAIEIGRADGHLAPEERRLLLQDLRRRFGLDQAESEALLEAAGAEVEEAVSLHQFTRLLNEHLRREEKVEVLRLLWQVALADGLVDRYEEYTIRKLADLLH
ncbi:MAG: TerB family tellurite resistance protein, partial [Gammaproteobacteria bacterium]